MKLIGTRIYAKCIKPEEKTASGIYVGQSTILENNRATVMFVGPKVQYFKPGDVIQYNPNGAIRHSHENSDGVFVREDLNELFKIDV